MKVYLVFSGYSSYFDVTMEGIFSTKEKAEGYLKTIRDPGWVEEHEVDNPE